MDHKATVKSQKAPLGIQSWSRVWHVRCHKSIKQTASDRDSRTLTNMKLAEVASKRMSDETWEPVLTCPKLSEIMPLPSKAWNPEAALA